MRGALALWLGVALAGCAPAEPDGAGEVCASLLGDAPTISLWQYGNEVQDGTALHLECGPQGVFMIPVVPELAGVSAGSEWTELDVTLAVEGFDLGPGGAFFHDPVWPMYVGCEPEEGENDTFIPMLVPDAIENVEALDGLPARLTVTVAAGDEPITVAHDVTIEAQNQGDYFFCYGQ